jgi:hypothetical protein
MLSPVLMVLHPTPAMITLPILHVKFTTSIGSQIFPLLISLPSSETSIYLTNRILSKVVVNSHPS